MNWTHETVKALTVHGTGKRSGCGCQWYLTRLGGWVHVRCASHDLPEAVRRELGGGADVIVTCIDPGQGLGLTLGATYEVVRVIDPLTVAVRSTERPDVSPEHVLDTWQHTEWPEAETLSPRMAGRFVAHQPTPQRAGETESEG